jgi:hypothetical protein
MKEGKNRVFRSPQLNSFFRQVFHAFLFIVPKNKKKNCSFGQVEKAMRLKVLVGRRLKCIGEPHPGTELFLRISLSSFH